MLHNNADWMREVENFSHRVKDYFENLDVQVQGSKRKEHFAVDLVEDNANLFLLVELPGMKKEEIQITMSGDRAVVISGVKSSENIAGARTIVGERWYGNFNRTIAIPEAIEVDSSRVSASYTDGVLKITLPKAGSSAGRSIEIL